MNQNLINYFDNLKEKSELPRKNNFLSVDNEKIRMKGYILTPTFFINNTPYYATTLFGNNRDLVRVFASKMYNDLGLISPPVYSLEYNKSEDNSNFTRHYLITQDIRTALSNLKITIAGSPEVQMFDDLSYTFKYLNNSNSVSIEACHKWDFITNQDIKDFLLKYMTEECYNQLTNLFLIDELITETDRHHYNYFFYQSPDSDKYEGIIAIDNEMSAVTNEDYVYDKTDLEYFIDMKYHSHTLTGKCQPKSYSERILDLRNLLNNGHLNESNIMLLKNTCTYDISKCIKESSDNHILNRCLEPVKTSFEYLWEYIQSTLGKDLQI